MRNRGSEARSSREFMFFVCLTLGFTMPVGILPLLGIVGSLVILVLMIPIYVYIARAWKYFWGTSAARAFWTYFGCTLVGGLAGELLLLPVYLIFGFPRYS